jgi:cell division protein FtsL
MESRAMVAVLGLLLVLSALALITSQHRARALFAELEVAQQSMAQDETENNRLRLELGRMAQPAAIEAAARQLGMLPVDSRHTALLPPLTSVRPAP